MKPILLAQGSTFYLARAQSRLKKRRKSTRETTLLLNAATRRLVLFHEHKRRSTSVTLCRKELTYNLILKE
jgi:hypothetical protein